MVLGKGGSRTLAPQRVSKRRHCDCEECKADVHVSCLSVSCESSTCGSSSQYCLECAERWDACGVCGRIYCPDCSGKLLGRASSKFWLSPMGEWPLCEEPACDWDGKADEMHGCYWCQVSPSRSWSPPSGCCSDHVYDTYMGQQDRVLYSSSTPSPSTPHCVSFQDSPICADVSGDTSLARGCLWLHEVSEDVSHKAKQQLGAEALEPALREDVEIRKKKRCTHDGKENIGRLSSVDRHSNTARLLVPEDLRRRIIQERGKQKSPKP